jgi:hypothetical protein
MTHSNGRRDIISAALGTISAFQIEYTESSIAIRPTQEMPQKRKGTTRRSFENLRRRPTQRSKTVVLDAAE